jgi:hypothetical protein
LRPPHPKKTSGAVDPSSASSDTTAEAERRVEAAIPLLSQAAGSEVLGMVGSHEPVTEVIGVENDAVRPPVSTQHMPAA